MRYILLLLLMMTNIAFADNVYKQLDANGNVVYSDKPLDKNATPVGNLNANIAPSNTSDQNDTQESKETPATPSDKPYTRFTIVSPADEESIQNQPTLTIKFDIDPALKKGDKIQAYLDGNRWDQPFPSNILTFTTPERGTHSVYGELLDKNSHPIMRTKSITIYVHQAHLGNQKLLNNIDIKTLPDRS